MILTPELRDAVERAAQAHYEVNMKPNGDNFGPVREWGNLIPEVQEHCRTHVIPIVEAALRPHEGGEVTLEEVARAIADQIGHHFDDVHRDKSEWIATGSVKNGLSHDVNGPFQVDYLNAAGAVLVLLQGDRPHD